MICATLATRQDMRKLVKRGGRSLLPYNKHAEAQVAMGEFCRMGGVGGVEKDLELAKDWFGMAAR